MDYLGAAPRAVLAAPLASFAGYARGVGHASLPVPGPPLPPGSKVGAAPRAALVAFQVGTRR